MNGSNDLFIGINEGELGEIAIDFVNFNDELSEIFSSIDSKMIELKGAFNSKEYQSLLSQYNDFKKNYSIVKNNINSYSDDLVAIINKVRIGDSNIASLLETKSNDVLDQAKLINNNNWEV